MSEHQIRLRGGWVCRGASAPELAECAVELPVRWGLDAPERVILTRRFGRPPLRADGETLLLRMENVRGVHAVSLNGRTLALGSSQASSHVLRLDDLLERNVLVLEVETPHRSPEVAGDGDLWGVISLVIQTVDCATNSPPRASSAPPGPPGVSDRINLE